MERMILPSVRLRHGFARYLGLLPTRQHQIDADIEVAPLERRAVDEAAKPCLGCRIGRLSGTTMKGGIRAEYNDRASPAFNQERRHSAKTAKGSGQVNGHEVRPRLVPLAQQQAAGS